MEFLTAEQAMADYAELIFDLKSSLKAENSPVIGFGGSYGEHMIRFSLALFQTLQYIQS